MLTSRTKTRAALAAILLVPLGGALAAPASAATGGIDGTVTGPGPAPLQGVTVTAYTKITEDPNNQAVIASTTTAANGTYHLAVAPTPSVVVCFQHTGYVQECWNGHYDDEVADGHYGDEIAVDADGVQGIDAAMIVGSSISGHLATDEGHPVTDAFVTALDPGTFFVFGAKTDANGNYTLDHLAPGSYRICVTGRTTMARCAADVGLPATYTVGTGDVVSGADLTFVARPHAMRIALTGADLIRWSWDRVPGATSYRIAVSTSPRMSNPVLRSPANNWLTLKGLVKGRTYYAMVRGVSDGFGFDPAMTAPSTKVAARPGYVASFRVVRATTTSLTWSWSRYVVRSSPLQLADEYVIRLSSSPTMQGYRTRHLSGPEAPIGRLQPGKTYYAQIEALNHGKVIAPFGPIKSGRTP